MWGFLDKLADRFHVVAFVAGVLLAVLGAAAGFEGFGAKLPTAGTEWRIAAFALGATAMVMGVVLALRRDGAKAATAAVDVKSVGAVLNVDVLGRTVRFHGAFNQLPSGMEPWIMTIAGASLEKRYWPRAILASDSATRTFITEVEYAAAMGGQTRRFAVFLVGPDGQRLIRFFHVAGRAIDAAGGGDWPGIPELTSDIVQCTPEREVTLGGARRRAGGA